MRRCVGRAGGDENEIHGGGMKTGERGNIKEERCTQVDVSD